MRLRLIASFILIVLVTTGIIIWVTARQTAEEVRSFMFRGGLTGREDVVLALEEYYETFGTWEGVDQILQTASRTPWRKPMGQGQGQGQGRDNNQAVDNSAVHLRLASVDGVVVAYSSDQDGTNPNERLTQTELSRALPLKLRGKTIGYLLPENNLAFTPANETSLVSRLNQAAITAVGIAVAVAVVLALLLSYTLVRPVRDLTQAASRLAIGDLSQRVQIKGSDELATLGQTFNHMAESLQQTQDSRRAMTADIAHELRTPLAVQRAHLEAIQDGVYPLQLESLTTIEEQNHLLTRLVEDLRTLALVDAGQLNLEITPMEIGDLVQRAAKRFEPQASERGIEILRTLEEDCPPVAIDSQRIQQILHNLLSNAMRYTPDGGRIFLVIVFDHSQVSLMVRDSGPGIPEDALSHIFDRFYRADRSRARSEGGTGLGLSIARKLAQAHGGDLTAANLPEGGAEFRLSLPVRDDV